MNRSFLKRLYYFIQLTVCIVWLLEKFQPRLLPTVARAYGLPATQLSQRQGRPSMPPPVWGKSRPRLFSWRRLRFLLF